MPQPLTYVLIAIAGGAIIPFHAGTNATLSRSIGSPIWATILALGISLTFLGILLFLLRPAAPSIKLLTATPWWAWLSGVIAVIYVVFTMLVAPKLGAATFMASVICGQMIAAALLDNYGLVGFPQHNINLSKIAGILIVIAGVMMVSFSSGN